MDGHQNKGSKPGSQVLDGPRIPDLSETNFINPTTPTITLDGAEVPHAILESVFRTVSEFDLLRMAADKARMQTGYKFSSTNRWGETRTGHKLAEMSQIKLPNTTISPLENPGVGWRFIHLSWH